MSRGNLFCTDTPGFWGGVLTGFIAGSVTYIILRIFRKHKRKAHRHITILAGIIMRRHAFAFSLIGVIKENSIRWFVKF